jgi:hypothetical protein
MSVAAGMLTRHWHAEVWRSARETQHLQDLREHIRKTHAIGTSRRIAE